MPKAKYCLDTCFLEQLEDSNKARDFLQKVGNGELFAFLSTVAAYEYTYRCYRRGKISECKKLFEELNSFTNLSIVDVDQNIAKKAAKLHHTYNIAACDAMIAATGLLNSCKYLVTEDSDFVPIKNKIKLKKVW